ncbi:MAG: hypothetical protein OMM_15058, partial [Candidatus Magnetoglobus multicellularis str. Araruama]
MFVQAFSTTHLEQSPKINRLRGGTALHSSHLDECMNSKPIECLLSAEPKAFGSLSRIKPIVCYSTNQPHHRDHLNQMNQMNHSFFAWFIKFATITDCVDALLSNHLKNIVKQNRHQ